MRPLPLVLVALAACGTAAPPRPADTLPFLVGAWTSDEKGFVTVERWQALPDGSLLGSGSATLDGRLLFAETLAVVPAQDGTLAYVAWPEGQGATVFPEVARERTKVTFANDAHPFPRRMTYTRVDPDTLEVDATGVEEDGSPRHETWRLVRLPEAPVTPPRAP
jgi:hypothetical protein